MWRIGQLARMAGVTERTLRHYDRIGLLRPAAVDAATGYRWYGVAELTRLERIRGLQHLGLPLRRIADLVDAPDTQVRQALADTLVRLRQDIVTMTAAVTAAEDHLTTAISVLPQRTTVGPRRLRVDYLRVTDPATLRCVPHTTLLTWLSQAPEGEFAAAMATGHGGADLTLPARDVVRAVVPPTGDVVRAGLDLFDWLRRHDLAVTGPTVEDHLTDADGAGVTVLEIPFSAGSPASPVPSGSRVRARRRS
jgi:DNA-binding transcriptional MerR regulator